MQSESKTGSRATPGRISPPSRSPDGRKATRRNETDAPNLEPPERRFSLANSEVIVSSGAAGPVARIERGDVIEYGVLAPGTVESLAEVAVSHE